MATLPIRRLRSDPSAHLAVTAESSAAIQQPNLGRAHWVPGRARCIDTCRPEDLLATVYRREMDELAAAAPDLLANHEPLGALTAWFDRVAAYARVERDVFAAEAATRRDLTAHRLGPIGGAVDLLLSAGRSAGEIRADAAAHDVIGLIGMLSLIDYEQSLNAAPKQATNLDRSRSLSCRWS